MKKFSVLLVALAVAVSASAGVNLKANRVVKSNKLVNTEMTKANLKNMKAKAQSFRVINEQPEGEVVNYDRSGDAIYPSGGSIYSGTQSGHTEIVYAEDGKVYLKNLLYESGSNFGDNWVEGQLNEDGTQITIPMGQSIYWSDSYQADVVLAWGTTFIDEREDGVYLGFTPDEAVTEVVYNVDGQTITGPVGVAPVEDEANQYWQFCATGLGCYWTDDDSFGGCLEWNTVWTYREPVVAPTVITEQPEGELFTYYRNSGVVAYNFFYGWMTSATDGKFSVVLAEDGKAYIQNPAWYYDTYNSWVEGTYDAATGIITIPTGQFLSWTDEYEYGIQLMWGSTYVYEDGVDEETGEPLYYLGNEMDERTTEIQFQMDGDYLYLLGSEGDVNAEFPESFNATGMYLIWSDEPESVNCVEIANNGAPFGQIANLVPAVPADPTCDEWSDYGDESGFSRLYFTLPTTDVDGNMLDPEYLSVSIYTDNGNGPELFTFDAATYSYDLTEDMTEIPYSIYNGGYDFQTSYFWFYRTNAEGYEPLFTENIGVQVFYTVNGVKNASNIAWLYDIDTNVDEINAGKTVANVRYFNVAGQEMAQPQGMTIMVTTYTDGTTSAAKVVK